MGCMCISLRGCLFLLLRLLLLRLLLLLPRLRLRVRLLLLLLLLLVRLRLLLRLRLRLRTADTLTRVCVITTMVLLTTEGQVRLSTWSTCCPSATRA